MKQTSKQSTYELYGRATPNRSTSNEARFKTKHVRPMKKHTAGLASDEKGSEIITYILWTSNGQTRSASDENCCLRKGTHKLWVNTKSNLVSMRMMGALNQRTYNPISGCDRLQVVSMW
jgi:hypothetical protein